MSKVPDQHLTFKDRLSYYATKRSECISAMRGERVPLALGMQVTQACIIRGIRHHPGYAQELHRVLPVFTRALHARSIMSNVIPDIQAPEEIPYCIWHPELASEATYRELVRKYPGMRYQVGRACAVAGYVGLYRELDLLPDVAIAEEARDSFNCKNGEENFGARVIFDEIMESAVLYSVLDDYTCTVNLQDPKARAYLNGDTAVRSVLDDVHVFEGSDGYTTPDCWGYKPIWRNRPYWNITEDFGVVDKVPELSSEEQERKEALRRQEIDTRTRLLYTPLPPHLPNINKDLLILRAAYSGNIERYTRLRRPVFISSELACIVRGIYHDTMFAKFWTYQPESFLLNSTGSSTRKAINARYIMNNDISRISPTTDRYDLPYLIYYPNFATKQTYQELLRLQPSMKPQIARAVMLMDEQGLWEALDPEPEFSICGSEGTWKSVLF